jgi:hypothetical protein
MRLMPRKGKAMRTFFVVVVMVVVVAVPFAISCGRSVIIGVYLGR